MKNMSILMVCTGNICRSPMAEGLCATLLPESIRPFVSVHSAGTHGLYGNRAEPFAIQAAARHGADIRNHRARLLDATMVRAADLVLVMEAAHLYRVNQLFFFRCNYARLLGSFESGRANPEIEDPYGMAPDAYDACADEITACIPGVIAHAETVLGV